jgi:hypothetical protein
MPSLTKSFAVAAVVMMSITSSAGFGQHRPDERRAVPPAHNSLPPRVLVDCPTAATLPRASFDVHVRDFAGGGLLTAINVGLHRRLTLGVSYGGTGVLGEQKAEWQDHPEFEAKYLVVPETMTFPAVTVGFASQGYGPYLEVWDRYTYKSKGFYAVASKAFHTYAWATGFHGGLNYSLEHTKDNDPSPDFFFGFDINVNRDVALVTEYDLGLNDDRKRDDKSVDEADTETIEFGGKGRGYLNIGLRWIFYERLELGIDLKNVLNNRRDVNQLSRELRINYYEFF